MNNLFISNNNNLLSSQNINSNLFSNANFNKKSNDISNYNMKNNNNNLYNINNGNTNYFNQNQNAQNKEELDVIFNHVFINMDGQKYIPNENNQIYYDQNLNDFVLPEEFIKEDNVTKMLRIKAILDSMEFDNEDIAKKFKITDPPIIRGIENIIPQMNKRENSSSEKIDTKIIKHDFENTYFLQKKDLNKKIREPPNFMI